MLALATELIFRKGLTATIHTGFWNVLRNQQDRQMMVDTPLLPNSLLICNRSRAVLPSLALWGHPPSEGGTVDRRAGESSPSAIVLDGKTADFVDAEVAKRGLALQLGISFVVGSFERWLDEPGARAIM
jgi:hypothetical protein